MKLRVFTSGHVTKMAITPFDPLYPKTPCCTKTSLTVCFTEQELLPIKVLNCGNRNFRPFWLLWPWPWPDGDKSCVQIWTFYVKAFKSYHLTDIHDQNCTPRDFAGGQQVSSVRNNWDDHNDYVTTSQCDHPIMLCGRHCMKISKSQLQY